MLIDAVDGFNPRDSIVAMLHLVAIDSPDGKHRFIQGVDHEIYTNNGTIKWTGTQLLKSSSMAESFDGAAPAGNLTMSFVQDPLQGSLVTQLKALGAEYLVGRKIEFYWLPIRDPNEWVSTNLAPILFATRIARQISYSLSGAQDRSITLHYESIGESRGVTGARKLNTAGHERMLGQANPSLEFMPTSESSIEKLFG